MNNTKFVVFIAAIALIALLDGCENETANKSNVNTTVAISNSNVNASANANRTANANRKAGNANISREEYERDKETLLKDAKRLGRTIGSGANDGWLWTKTRAELAMADDLRESTINVDVENAVVTLSGTVATPAQKTKAAQVAKSIEGVKSVKNNLSVSANP
jgi:hypothetical protein